MMKKFWCVFHASQCRKRISAKIDLIHCPQHRRTQVTKIAEASDLRCNRLIWGHK